MVIKTNNDKEIEILEPDIIINDEKIFNETTGLFEALDGDRICFVTYLNSGHKVTTAGTVDGYTYDGRIKLKNAMITYKATNGYVIEHRTKVVDYINKNAVIAEISYAD